MVGQASPDDGDALALTFAQPVAPAEKFASDPFKGGFRLLITGPQAFERTLVLAFDDDPAVIAERVREILEE